MKKLAVLLFGTLLFTGCGSTKEELKLKCTSSKDMSKLGYTIDANYEVYGSGEYVTRIVSNEYATSDNEQTLTSIEQALTLNYTKYNLKYGGYDNKVSIDGNTLTSKTNIDYRVVDLDQLTNDTPALKSYTKNGKLKVEGLKKLYESMGATCE